MAGPHQLEGYVVQTFQKWVSQETTQQLQHSYSNFTPWSLTGPKEAWYPIILEMGFIWGKSNTEWKIRNNCNIFQYQIHTTSIFGSINSSPPGPHLFPQKGPFIGLYTPQQDLLLFENLKYVLS